MYRHFAAVTIVLTLALAMFAEGENRETAAVGTAPQVTSGPEKPAKFVAPSRSARSASGFTSGFDEDFGGSMTAVFGGNGSGVIPDEALGVGYSSAYLASLSDEERELLLKGLRESGMLDPAIRADRSAALAAASRRRSGAPAGAD